MINKIKEIIDVSDENFPITVLAGILFKINEIINHLNVQTDSQKAESNFKIIDDKNGFISIDYMTDNKSLLDAASFNAQDYGLNVVQQAAINNMAKVLNALRDMYRATMGAEWVELNSHTILETATIVVAFK